MGKWSVLLTSIFFLLSSCGTVTSNPENQVSGYSASAAWKWQNTECFVLRGRARLQGENQVFSGPFMLLSSATDSRIRADFCGPDGSPLLSLSGDSTGFLFYYPDEGRAFFHPSGLPVNQGYLGVNAVISLVRTGFPAVPVPRQMAETYEIAEDGGILWRFTSSGEDSMSVLLCDNQLFPSIVSSDISLSVSASSWHDSFNAWPMEWLLSSPSLSVVIRLRSMDVSDTLPPETPWNLSVPVPVDTIGGANREWVFEVPVTIR